MTTTTPRELGPRASSPRATRPRAPARIRRVGCLATIVALGAAGALAPPNATAAEPAADCVATRPCLISDGLAPGFGAPRPQLTPDGNTVVFDHAPSANEARQLYSAPVRGGRVPVRLDSANAPPGRQVTITPDGRRVLYLSQRPQGFALFSVPVAGPASDAVRLDPSVLGGFQLSPNGRLVVRRSATGRIRVTPVAGPESRTAVLTPGPVDSFGISGDGRSVVYIAGGAGGARELFRVRLTLDPDPGQPPTRLSGPMVDGGGVRGFHLPRAGNRVVYHAAQEQRDIAELYSVRLGGTGRVKLNEPLPFAWRVRQRNEDPFGFQLGYAVSDDGETVVYETSPLGSGTEHELYSVPAEGPASASRRIDIATPDSLPTGFRFAAQDRLVYMVSPRGGRDVTYSVPVRGPADARIPVSSSGPDGAFVQVSPDGRRVVSRAVIFNQQAVLSGLVTERVHGPSTVRLNGPERTVGAVTFDPTSRRAAYVGRTSATERDVYSSSLTTSGSRFNLTSGLPSTFVGGVLAVGEQHIVYSVSTGDDSFQLYSSPLVPPG